MVHRSQVGGVDVRDVPVVPIRPVASAAASESGICSSAVWLFTDEYPSGLTQGTSAPPGSVHQCLSATGLKRVLTLRTYIASSCLVDWYVCPLPLHRT